jgi:hypothetical protein
MACANPLVIQDLICDVHCPIQRNWHSQHHMAIAVET